MLILLDIDGVMVPGYSWKSPKLLSDGFPKFNYMASIALQKLIFDKDADILLTTSHRFRYSVSEWYDIFRKRGIILNKIDILPKSDFLNRKDEILNWFKENRIDSFIIIDDDKSLNDLPKLIKDKLILTNSLVGLNDDLLKDFLIYN